MTECGGGGVYIMPSYGGESASLEFILRSACPDEITRMKSGRGGGGEGGQPCDSGG